MSLNKWPTALVFGLNSQLLWKWQRISYWVRYFHQTNFSMTKHNLNFHEFPNHAVPRQKIVFPRQKIVVPRSNHAKPRCFWKCHRRLDLIPFGFIAKACLELVCTPRSYTGGLLNWVTVLGQLVFTMVFYGIRLHCCCYNAGSIFEIRCQTLVSYNTKALWKYSQQQIGLWPLQDQLVKTRPHRLISPSGFLFQKKRFDTP